MKKNILRVAICVALIAGVSACTSSIQDVRLDMPEDPGDLRDGLGLGASITIRMGELIDGPIDTDSAIFRCGGCVKEIKPNRPPLSAHEPCTPLPCSQAESEMRAFEQGVLVMRAMLRAHHRGQEVEFVLPAPATQP